MRIVPKFLEFGRLALDPKPFRSLDCWIRQAVYYGVEVLKKQSFGNNKIAQQQLRIGPTNNETNQLTNVIITKTNLFNNLGPTSWFVLFCATLMGGLGSTMNSHVSFVVLHLMHYKLIPIVIYSSTSANSYTPLTSPKLNPFLPSSLYDSK
jgi:hypothetical protein